MDKDKMKQGKKCFIITPIGNENSDTFRKAKGVIESVIKPVLVEYGFDDIKPAYEINISGMINTQIINRIIDDDLVIANLTGNNPNVMYELCLRHVTAKPIIHICEDGTSLPFDIKDNRTIFYTNDMLGVEELKIAVNKFMAEISFDEDCLDNPIYSAYRVGKLLKETKGTESNEILKMLVAISGQVSELKIESDSKNSKNASSATDVSTYTVGQFVRDVSTIEKEKIEEAKKIENKMQVYELAKYLNTSSKAILNIAKIIGVNAKAMASTLSCDDKNKILKYIMDESYV